MTPQVSGPSGNDVEGLVERLTRPIIGIEYRSAQEAFDIMADRIRAALSSLQAQPVVKAEPVATLEIFDGRSTTYIEEGAFKLPDGKHKLYTHPAPAAGVKPDGWDVLRVVLEVFDRSDVPTHYHSHPGLCDAMAKARGRLQARDALDQGEPK